MASLSILMMLFIGLVCAIPYLFYVLLKED